jgi:hypothetical protein
MQLLADDHGRLLDSPKAIAGSAFPLDEEFTTELSTNCITELVTAGWIRRYSGDGRDCLYVEGWNNTQKVAHKTPSTLPDPESAGHSHSGDPHELLMNPSGEVHASVCVSVPVSASGSVEEIVDSRVPLRGDPGSVSSSSDDQEIPMPPALRRQVLALPRKMDANRTDPF